MDQSGSTIVTLLKPLGGASGRLLPLGSPEIGQCILHLLQYTLTPREFETVRPFCPHLLQMIIDSLVACILDASDPGSPVGLLLTLVLQCPFLFDDESIDSLSHYLNPGRQRVDENKWATVGR